MASWTTPRTGNVSDVFTAAWYNAEIKADEVWLHDIALSQGSTFPASPLTGQKHLFVSGNVREMFAYDGTNWYSEQTALQLIRGISAAGVTAETWVMSPSSGAAADFTTMYEPTLDVDAYMAAGMTLQGRLNAVLDNAATKTVVVGLAVSNFVTNAQAAGRTRVSGTAVTTSAGGFLTGSWADLLTGSYQGARIGLYGSWSAAGGSPAIYVQQATAYVRFKK